VKAKPGIPSTSQLQGEFASQTRSFLGMRFETGKARAVHALVWCEDFEISEETFDDFPAFEYALPDMMATRHHVVALIIAGEEIGADKIDALKQVALDELKGMPISYARALGRL
jgi:hypothetical protein